MMTNLVGKTRLQLEALLAPVTDTSYRAEQVANWLLHRNAVSFDEMTNLPKNLRSDLMRLFTVADPPVVGSTKSVDGTRKYLFKAQDGVTFEGVSIPDGEKLTLCLSSQSGCALGCVFCVTGTLGPGRNLSSSEIVGQLRTMVRDCPFEPQRINVVFMGMGEALLNLENLKTSLEVLYERISPKRITVSTAGHTPGLRALAKMERRPKIAVSLNAGDQELREELMPIAKRFTLDEVMSAVRAFPLERGRRITFEYVLLDGVNDRKADAKSVTRLLEGIPSKTNLIPFNGDSTYLPQFQEPAEETIQAFAEVLRKSGLTVTVRRSRGSDVAAACGQLKGSVEPQRTIKES
jgi:23S rRNA (adenine2503-C2)-methyltransferase